MEAYKFGHNTYFEIQESTRTKLILERVGVMQIKGRVQVGKQRRRKEWNSWQKKTLQSRFSSYKRNLWKTRAASNLEDKERSIWR